MTACDELGPAHVDPTADRDFPLYRDLPGGSLWRWLVVLAGVAAGFAALVSPLPFFVGPSGALAKALLFSVIPLTALALVAGGRWRALFHRVGPRDIGWMFVFALLNILVTAAVGFAVMRLFGATQNPLVVGLAGMPTGDLATTLGLAAVQLLGEELLTVLPFLALLALFAGRFGFSRRASILWAWLCSAMLFGAAHLPTYGWNLIQCLLVIGSARLVLTLPYLKTKNLWVSYGAHFINDMSLFAGAIVLSRLGAGAG